VSWTREWRWLAALAGGFVIVFYLPVGAPRFDAAVLEAFQLAKWYAREHVLLCLVPALFIAGGIAVFVSQAAVMKYLGAGAPKALAYGVASVSGSVLAVCSCTVLPLFAGIYRMGAGLGPATAFLYAGPAINVLAIILTARVLGLELGLARAVGAIVFSIVIGLAMHALFREDEAARVTPAPVADHGGGGRSLGQEATYFGAMVAVLVFANWGAPQGAGGVFAAIHDVKWWLTAAAAAVLALALARWFARDEIVAWVEATWEFTKLIVPLLFVGVLLAGLLLGRPGHEGLIPSAWVSRLVGGNSLQANLFASVVGAFMYFATLTEVPILEGLLGAGMGKGPALALLLAGPALSLPSMLVIRGILGTRRTLAFVALVVVMATVSGVLYGWLF